MKIYILKQWVSGHWENVKATTDEWEAGHWVENEPDMNYDYDEFEIEEKRN